MTHEPLSRENNQRIEYLGAWINYLGDKSPQAALVQFKLDLPEAVKRASETQARVYDLYPDTAVIRRQPFRSLIDLNHSQNAAILALAVREGLPVSGREMQKVFQLLYNSRGFSLKSVKSDVSLLRKKIGDIEREGKFEVIEPSRGATEPSYWLRCKVNVYSERFSPEAVLQFLNS